MIKNKQIIYALLAGALLFGVAFKASAQNVERIYMKSGSIVEGYIAEQIPGKRINVKTTKSTIVVNSDSLKYKSVEQVPLESLPREWADWAEQNDKVINNNGKKHIELTTLEFENSVFPLVYLLERGSMIKFLDVTPNEYSFSWNEMYRTVKNQRPSNLFSGLKEILVLTDDSMVEGQIIEQLPEQNLKIATDDGEVLSFKYSQIKQIRTEKLNEDLDLWSQIQLLDKIAIAGEKDELVGFISERTFGEYIVFESQDGIKRTIPQRSVVSYSKIPNDRYVAVYDTILQDGEVLIDGEPAYFVKLNAMDKYLVLGTTVSLQKNVGDSVCLEAKLADTETPITLVKAHIEDVTVTNGRRKRVVPWPVITYQDLVQSHVDINREVTPLHNIKVTFDVVEEGDYVLHIQGREDYIVINVVASN